MKVTCEIINDLLPLYVDGLCSHDSKTAIEEHIETCHKCKSELQDMQLSITASAREQNLNEAAVVKMLSKEWRRSKWKALLKGVIYTLIIVAILALILAFPVDLGCQ